MADAKRDVTRIEWGDVEQPSIDIVQAVARVTDRDPTELPPLARTVDGDAVEVLLRDGGAADLRISFTYAGTSVVVDCDGSIEVSPVTA